MPIKSYDLDTQLSFPESEIAPIHIADHNERQYYSFAKGITPPKGAKAVTDSELADVLLKSVLIRQIKEEAERRIIDIAPLWKQQNALSDIYLLGDRTDLSKAEQEQLIKAEGLIASVQLIRKRSDAIEASFLSGVAVDYLTDKGWEDTDAQ